MANSADGLVHVRTPTYRRPELLRRALDSLIRQTWANWVCDVYDDDPEGSAEAVCRAVGDARVHFNQNRPQKLASKNIDDCFSRANPREADYFCVVEDDNFLLPGFMAENIAVCREQGVEVVLRNQRIEHEPETPQAWISEDGILDAQFEEGRYSPKEFRLAVLVSLGVSNGGLFWSRDAGTDFSVGHTRADVVLDEPLRTLALADDIYVAREPLAVWANHAAATNRFLGTKSGYLRREFNAKRGFQIVRQAIWRTLDDSTRQDFLDARIMNYPARQRVRELVKYLVQPGAGDLGLSVRANLLLRGLAIRLFGRTTPAFRAFVVERTARSNPAA